MSNETLILKTAVATDSTVKLTDCPMSSGEILEMVCRLYANGLTSGNRCFKAIGNAVTYNTDAVTEGDIYCVSYRDGGFYVGLRTTEDYEPKEGDWWCFKAVFQPVPYKPKMAGRNNIGVITEAYQYISYYDNKSAQLIGGTKCTSTYYDYYFSTSTNNKYGNVVLSKNKKNEYLYPLQLNDTTLGYNLLAASDDTNGRWNHLIEDFDIDLEHSFPWYFISKFITASDILSYQNTNKMGGIILGEELEVTGNTVTSLKQILYDSNTQIAVFIFDENGNMINLNMSAVSGIIGAKCSIYRLNADDSSKKSIFNIYSINQYNYMYIYQYDYASYYENDIKHRLIFEHNSGGIEYSYTIRAFKVLQNNMATPSLLSNNLNSNNIPNDETDG